MNAPLLEMFEVRLDRGPEAAGIFQALIVITTFEKSYD